MRVVLLSTSDLAGGAARAAFRLLHRLRTLDHDCSKLVRQKLSTDKEVHPVALDRGRAARQHEREAGRIRQNCIERNRTAIIEAGKNGLPVPAGDAGALAGATQEFAADPELRRNLAGGCAAQVRTRFGLREQARKYEPLYEKLRPSGQAASPKELPTSVQRMAPFGRGFEAIYPRLLRYARKERFKKRWPMLSRLLQPDRV